ncbi:MAG: hypothetical protein IJT16_00015 [Lachnospiraceae bacterium]|nr:hypothetical protein [Lachnospiraceae bacterium]
MIDIYKEAREKHLNSISTTITIRTSVLEKERLKKKAEKKKKSLGQYLRDCGLAGLERRTDRDRKMVQKKVVRTEYLNRLAEQLKTNDNENLKETLREYLETEITEWKE